LAFPLIGERVRPRSWIAIAVGFAGVLVIVRPDNGLTDPASLLPLVAAAAYSVSALLARRLGTTESGSAMALSATAVYIVAGAITAAVLTGIDASPTTHDSLRLLINPWVLPSLLDFG